MQMTGEESILIFLGVLGILFIAFILVQIMLYLFHAIGAQTLAKRQKNRRKTGCMGTDR